jgi:hypothetical protein
MHNMGGSHRGWTKTFSMLEEESHFFVQPRNAAETGYRETNFPPPTGPREIVQFMNIIALFFLFSTSWGQISGNSIRVPFPACNSSRMLVFSISRPAEDRLI